MIDGAAGMTALPKKVSWIGKMSSTTWIGNYINTSDCFNIAPPEGTFCDRDYFDACDGIFLNYTWTAEHLSRTVAQAGSRILDVFVGVDIFGRNCFGGGGFNTSAALSVVRCEMGLSTAMFAPGWVYEHFPDDFSAQSCKFWSLILPYLSIRGPAASLPFHTSFCPGYGQVEYSKGQVCLEQQHLLIDVSDCMLDCR